MKYIKFLILFFISVQCFAQLGGEPGAFTRLGFSARGISMGNAMTSVTTGDLTGYYNPAVSVFQNEHLINLSYSFLSFDRHLNFVSYTKNFKIPGQEHGGAGVTFSWINAGVSNIDGRDIDGFKTDMLSVFENQFTFTPAIRFSERFAAGIGFKFYYSKLYEGVSANSLGFDVGAVYSVTDRLNIGLTVKDLKTKYEWNTTDLYGQYGNTTKEEFPVLYTLGTSYALPNLLGLISADIELSNKKTKIIRMGAEFTPVKNFSIRGGFDRFDFNATDKFGSSKFMFGVGYQRPFSNFNLGIDYAFVMEPYSNKPFQTLTAVLKFK